MTSNNTNIARQFAQFRRELAFYRYSLVALIVAGTIISFGAVSPSPQESIDRIVSGAKKEKIIQANGFRLVDTDGKLRAEWKLQNGNPGLFLLDSDGKQRVALWHDPETTALHINDQSGDTRVGVALFPPGGGFALHGPNMKGAAVMTLLNGQPTIRFFNDEGKVITSVPAAK